MGPGERAQIPAAQTVTVSHPLWPVAIYLSELGTCTYPRCIGGVYVGQGLRMRMLMGSRRTKRGNDRKCEAGLIRFDSAYVKPSHNKRLAFTVLCNACASRMAETSKRSALLTAETWHLK